VNLLVPGVVSTTTMDQIAIHDLKKVGANPTVVQVFCLSQKWRIAPA